MREQTFDKLYSLKLHGLAQALEEQIKNPEASSLGFEDRLAALVDAQWLWRDNRAVRIPGKLSSCSGRSCPLIPVMLSTPSERSDAGC